MGKPSQIDRVPPSVRAKIIQLIDEGYTLDEIMQALDLKKKHQISRSSLGRYKQRTARLTERRREQRAMAEVIVSARRTDLDSKTARLNVQLVHTLIADIVSAAADEGKMKAADVASITKSLDHLMRVERQDIDLISKIREEARIEATEEAQRKIDAMLKTGRDPREMSTAELRQAIKNAMLKQK